MSLNHPIREKLPIDFSAVLPPQILPAYQSQITGIRVVIKDGTPGRIFKLELKGHGGLLWKKEVDLKGGRQVIDLDLPILGEINEFVWVLDHGSGGDYVIIERVSLRATTEITDTATAAFVWSYGMLLNNWNPSTGLVRDKAKDPSGDFDAVQSTGSLAAATALAEQLDIIAYADAVEIVGEIGDTLLRDLPRYHGLWPHWVKVSGDGKIGIVPNTEWSSVDSVIAALGLLTAQTGLGIESSSTEEMLRSIDWSDLVTPSGISHGYTYTGDLIPYAWDAFGGESWLVELAYAGATSRVAPLAYPAPPTANGSGFIDELAWLFVPPPSEQDYWGTGWETHRLEQADAQLSYYPTQYPGSCFGQAGLFGLSAAEVPDPSLTDLEGIYQAFGIGGRFAPPNDGVPSLGAPTVVPHYAAMVASLRPQEAIKMWDWLVASGLFSPLTNVESLMFLENGDCDPSDIVWNQLKGSWNLSLQTLGWGRYLAEREGQFPILWRAAETNPLLHDAYLLIHSGGPISPPGSTSGPWEYERECEYPDEETVGLMIHRSNASGQKVHGQFGTVPAWPAKPGHVQFTNIQIPQTDSLHLTLRYSKYSSSSVPILITIDDEPTPRATITPADQGDWNNFTWTEPIPLGSVESGVHSVKFSTDGQEYGVADLDQFVLTTDIVPVDKP